jgi:histidinol-phosphate phosphatase family protein
MNLSTSNVVILAGGMGTRLRERSGDLPKPMVPIIGKPVLQHSIELCVKFNFNRILLLVHHHHEVISNYFQDGRNFGASIQYAIEKEPRGTSGALRDALNMLDEDFLVLYGDTFIDVDLRRFWDKHFSSAASGSLLLHPNDHPHDSDLVEVDSNNRIIAIHGYPHNTIPKHNLVNAGLYVLNKHLINDATPSIGKADIAKNMFPLMLELGAHLNGYITPEYIKDMGTPDRLDKVERDFQLGLPERLSTRHLRSAIFLDRDGTLISEVNHLTSPDQVSLLEGVAPAVKQINHFGSLAVVVTNQPVVARGDISFEQLSLIHAKLETDLGVNGAYLDKIYFCPHHPDKGFPGEIPELKLQCECRKPEPGLINLACSELSIDRRKSWMIGDTTSDIETGRRAGIRTILLKTGYSGADGKYAVRPDYVCSDLLEAVNWIFYSHSELSHRMALIANKVCNGTRLVLIGGLARSGKSFAAQVLKELMSALGRTAHIVSLDGWLHPANIRLEGTGVCSRYDIIAASKEIIKVVNSDSRIQLTELLYDRINRTAGPLKIHHSIGTSDTLIVEGVPALLMDNLNSLPDVVKIFIDIESTTRLQRISKDYTMRGKSSEFIKNIHSSREIDETPIVMKSRDCADFIL